MAFSGLYKAFPGLDQLVNVVVYGRSPVNLGNALYKPLESHLGHHLESLSQTALKMLGNIQPTLACPKDCPESYPVHALSRASVTPSISSFEITQSAQVDRVTALVPQKSAGLAYSLGMASNEPVKHQDFRHGRTLAATTSALPLHRVVPPSNEDVVMPTPPELCRYRSRL